MYNKHSTLKTLGDRYIAWFVLFYVFIVIIVTDDIVLGHNKITTITMNKIQ